MLMGYLYYFLHGVHRTQHITNVGHANQLGLLAEERLVSFHVEYAIIAHRYHLHHYALLLCLQLPRHYVGVVFHSRYDNLVASLHVCLHKT